MLRLHVPSREEFGIRRGWLLDPEMMSYNAGWQLSYPSYDPDSGCIDWPDADWPAFEQRLALPSTIQGYFYVQDNETGEFLGHVHYQVVAAGTAEIGLNVIPGRRGTGMGSAFMDLLLGRVWHDTDAKVVVNEFEDDRLAAVRLHQHHGFVPDLTTNQALGRTTSTWRLQRNEPRLARS